MEFTNSPLVTYTRLSPNNSGQRTHSIDRITPHCVVGQCTAEGLGDWFSKSSTQASSNYGIDRDGRIGMYVEEKNRSWCSSNRPNDQRAVTIECASDAAPPYAFKDIVYDRLIELCVDICKRNGKSKLLWLVGRDDTLSYEPKEDEMILTVHRWFDDKSCPGDWMFARMGDLAEKVTAQLKPEPEPKPEPDDEEEGYVVIRYNSIDLMPEWAQPTIMKLCDKGHLRGSGGPKDKHGRPADLNLSMDMIRIFVILDRAGEFD